MKIILPILLLSISCYSQHTERFQNLAKSIELDSVLRDTVYSRNGSIKSLYEQSFYTFDDIIVSTFTGESKVYHSNGNVARHDMQDPFGNWLWSKYYNKNGVLTKEWITTEIDTRAKSIEQFFSSHEHIDFKRTIKHYRISKMSDQLYTHKIEYLVLSDNIGGGKVEHFAENGQLKRIRTIKNKKR